MNLKNAVAVVTGATRGVGRGVAHELARQGVRVFITGRSVPSHAPFDEPITAIRCDHADDEHVDAVFERIVHEAEAIDILVNSLWGGYERMIDDGAFTWPKPFWEQPLWRWDSMFTAGVRAHYHASQLAARAMVAKRRGLIVNISLYRAFGSPPQTTRVIVVLQD
jgi:dehydrogenase/reductase SDR family member 1